MDLHPDVPSAIVELLDAVPLYMPDDVPEDSLIVYKRASEGRCMTCGRPVREGALAVINNLGLIMLFDSTTCMTDMQLRGWLEQVYGDLVDAIKFRANDDQ